MITKIKLEDVASFKQVTIFENLKKINYIYGANGTGKTTISRAMAQIDSFPLCRLDWEGHLPLTTMVYNRDFIESNFHQASGAPEGIFTLGQNQVEAEKKIAVHKNKMDELEVSIKNINVGLDKENNALKEEEKKFNDKCWDQKTKHEKYFIKAFSGLLNSKEAFKNRILAEVSSSAKLLDFDDLKQKAQQIFSENLEKITPIPKFDCTELIECERNALLSKIIVGSQNVDISAMILKLSNSDWVKQGVEYYNQNNKTCPFCQQATTESFHREIEEFFDESFMRETKAVNELANKYKNLSDILLDELRSVDRLQPKHLDHDSFRMASIALKESLNHNQNILVTKQKEPSQQLSLGTILELTGKIKELINQANNKIITHNKIVDNRQAEEKELRHEIWRYIAHELKTDISLYQNDKTKFETKITGLTNSLKEDKEREANMQKQIKELQKSITSIEPTKDAINQSLKLCGLTSFQLKISDDQSHYQICRDTDTSAAEGTYKTLSEGEKTFLTFLYFCERVKEVSSSSEITDNRVVVFDDPISSLDSDILHIVSCLIR